MDPRISRLALIVLVTMLPALAEPAADTVATGVERQPPGLLILHSNQRPTAAGIVIEDTLRTVVPAALKRPVGLYSEYLDEEWSSIKAYGGEQAQFFRQKYSGRNIRVLIAAAPQAGCDLFLALLSIQENGAAEYTGFGSRRRWQEPELEAGEVLDRYMGLSDWRLPDGSRWFTIARTVSKPGAGFRAPGQSFALALGCEIAQAAQLVYADGIDLKADEAAAPIGLHCRLCERPDCDQRAFPPLHHVLSVDENLRGATPYQFAPAT